MLQEIFKTYANMILALAAITAAAADHAGAQALCGPGFGINPPGQICVTVQTDPPTNMHVLLGSSSLLIPTMAGDYQTMLIATFVSTPLGMAVTLQGRSLGRQIPIRNSSSASSSKVGAPRRYQPGSACSF